MQRQAKTSTTARTVRETRPTRRSIAQVQTLEARRHLSIAGSVDSGVTKQTIEALGAASTAWYYGPELNNAPYFDSLVGDLGATGVRMAISPNFEVANDNNDPNVFDWTKFDSSQLAHVMHFNQRMKERGAKEFFVSLWTPPFWMKTNQAVAGGGSLRADMYEEFAEYVAAIVIASKRDYGIDIDAVGLQNEQIFVEPYESAQYNPITMRNAILAVQKKFRAEHLPTRVILNEDFVRGFSVDRWKWFNDVTLESPAVDFSKLIVGAHGATQEDTGPYPTMQPYLDNLGIPLWYTETSGEQANWNGAMRHASALSDVFTKANATSYYYWLYSDGSWGATAALMADGVPNPKYQALKHFYRYIRPGMKRMQTTLDESTSSRLAAFKSDDGKATFVLVNYSYDPQTYTIDLNGANFGSLRGFQSTDGSYFTSLGNVAVSGTLNITLPANAIVTLTSVADPVALPGNPNPQTYVPLLVDTVYDDPVRDVINNYYWWDDNDVQQILNLMDAPGFNPNAAGIGGWTMLHAAAARNYFGADRIIAKLIALGANVNATNSEGLTPLHVLAANQTMDYLTGAYTPNMKVNAFDNLVAAGANVNARDAKGRTPLIWAAMSIISSTQWDDDPRMVRRLLTAGADKTLTDNSGRTAYDWALQEYKPALFSWLWGANLDARPPVTQYTGFNQDTRTYSIIITEDVTATLTASDVLIADALTFAPYTGGFTLDKRFSNGLTYVDIHFPTNLPDGRYLVNLLPGSYADQNGVATLDGSNNNFTRLGGDANGDAKVDFNDLLLISQNYGKTGKHYRDGDFNGDGVVNFDDLLRLAQNYNKTLAVAAAFVSPSPSTLGGGQGEGVKRRIKA